MIRKKLPDIKKALSLIESAKREMNFTLSLPLTAESTNTIIRNIYENFRMLGEALLTAEGIESKEHTLPINKIISLNINASRSLITLDNLRRLRRNINYYGYMASIPEAEDVVDFAEKCFGLVFNEVEKILKNMQK